MTSDRHLNQEGGEILHITFLDVLGGPVVEEPASQCRRHGLDPWSGKIPHASKPLSLHTTTEAHALGPACCNTRSPCAESLRLATREAPAMSSRHIATEQPPRLQLEKAHVLQDPIQPKIIN